MEELRIVELDMEVSICEIEHGEILGDDEISVKDLMKYWDSSRKHENMLIEEADEATKPYIFKFDKLCVSTGLTEDDGQSFGTITKMDESFEVRYDGECLLNEENIELLQQKEFISEFLFGTIAKQGHLLV